MNRPLWWCKAEKEIHTSLGKFTGNLHSRLIQIARKPETLLTRRNIFLYRIRAASKKADEIIQNMIDARLSSSEETIFGNILEECAEISCRHGKDGRKSGITGIDLEYVDNIHTRVLIQVKSSKNWGNSSQKKQLLKNFQNASKILKQSHSITNVRCIEGVSYGKKSIKYLGTHEIFVGAHFWNEISGWDDLYYYLFKCVCQHATNGLQDLQEIKSRTNNDVIEFMRGEMLLDGEYIHWNKLLNYVS